MAQQFKRAYELSLVNPDGQGIKTSDLRMVFEITKDLFGYPNLAKISLFNLSLQTLNRITEEFTNVVLKAGYRNNIVLLFKGSIRNVINRRDAVDTITDIYAGDGEREVKQALFSKTFAPGTGLSQIVNEIADTFGIPKAKLDGLDSARKTLNGVSMSGRTKDILDKLSDDYNFYWSIQDGQFVTQDRESYDTDNRVIEISRSTGMIGSPAVTELGADVRILLNPDVQPYRAVKIITPATEVNVNNLFFRENPPTLGTGLFRVNKVIHSGDTRGNGWFSSITGRRF